MNYISINKKAYDDLAAEFEDKIQIRKHNQKKIIDKFISFLDPNVNDILEIGPAAGYTTKLLCEHGKRTTAIELSPLKKPPGFRLMSVLRLHLNRCFQTFYICRISIDLVV